MNRSEKLTISYLKNTSLHRDLEKRALTDHGFAESWPPNTLLRAFIFSPIHKVQLSSNRFQQPHRASWNEISMLPGTYYPFVWSRSYCLVGCCQASDLFLFFSFPYFWGERAQPRTDVAGMSRYSYAFICIASKKKECRAEPELFPGRNSISKGTRSYGALENKTNTAALRTKTEFGHD